MSRRSAPASSWAWTASSSGAGTKGAVWQLTATDVHSSFAWAELVRCPKGHPTGEQTSRLARRVAWELSEAGWRLERVLSDNGGEFRSRAFTATLEGLGVRHTRIRGRWPGFPRSGASGSV